MPRVERGRLVRALSAATLPAVLATSAQAQLSACAATPVPFTTSRDEWLVGPESAVQLESGLWLFGAPRVVVRKDAATGAKTVDSAFAAIRLDGSGAAHLIPLPRESLAVAHTRAIKVGPDKARVFFRSVPPNTPAEPDTALVELWTGLVGPDGWSGLRLIGSSSEPSLVTRQLSGDPVEHDREIVFAFAQPRGPTGLADVSLVRVRGDSVRVSAARLPFVSISYVSLASYEGALWLAVVASRHEDQGYLGIWVTRMEGERWLPPNRLLVGGTVPLNVPHLIPTAEGLVLAWWDRTKVREGELNWMSATAPPDVVRPQSMASGPIIVRGTHPFQHLLASQSGSATAKVIQLTPTGHREVATLPSTGFAPVIAGDPDRPVAIAIMPNDAKPDNSTVGFFDLRCGLPATSPPRRR